MREKANGRSPRSRRKALLSSANTVKRVGEGPGRCRACRPGGGEHGRRERDQGRRRVWTRRRPGGPTLPNAAAASAAARSEELPGAGPGTRTDSPSWPSAGSTCQWQPKTAHFGQLKTAQLREKGTDQIRAEIHGERPSVSYRAGSSRAHVSASMRYALGSMLGASPVHHKHPDQYRHPEHGPLCGCGRPQSMVLGLGAAVSENLLDVTCVRCLDASLERVAGDGPAKGGSIKPVLTIEDRCCVCGEPGCIDPTALGREGMCPACRSHHDQATANLETRGGRRAPPVDPVRRAGR